MKVMVKREWMKTVICVGCGSYIRIEQGDILMTADEEMHFNCMVCDTKNVPEEVPEYVVRRLTNLLKEKQD